jgi:hypothetical protein
MAEANGPDVGLRVAAWRQVPHIPWANVVAAARPRMVGATRKLGDLELDVLLEEIARLAAPRVVLDLRDVEDPDDLKTSEVFALGPGLQRALAARGNDTRVAYRLANEAVAETLAAQFTLHSVPARGGAPAQPLLGLADVQGTPRLLGPLPRYLEEAFALLAAEGTLTAVTLNEQCGTALATASDYLGELHRLRVALRERESLPGGGSRFVYSLGF